MLEKSTYSIDLKRRVAVLPGGPIAWGSSSTQQPAIDSLSTPAAETNATNTQNYLTKEEYFNVSSPRGENTILIVIDRAIVDKGRVLAHEGGHGLLDIKHMMKLIKWYANNPGKSKGGHGGGNPSGEEADRQEKIYINEKIKRTKQ